MNNVKLYDCNDKVIFKVIYLTATEKRDIHRIDGSSFDSQHIRQSLIYSLLQSYAG